MQVRASMMKVGVMQSLRLGLLGIAFLAIAIPACAVQPTSEQHAPAATSVPMTENKAVEAARIELAGRLNVEADQISVFSLERIVWPDSCLAIPSPGEVCTPNETPGFRLILTVADSHFTYHTDLTGDNLRQEIAGSRGG